MNTQGSDEIMCRSPAPRRTAWCRPSCARRSCGSAWSRRWSRPVRRRRPPSSSPTTQPGVGVTLPPSTAPTANAVGHPTRSPTNKKPATAGPARQGQEGDEAPRAEGDRGDPSSTPSPSPSAAHGRTGPTSTTRRQLHRRQQGGLRGRADLDEEPRPPVGRGIQQLHLPGRDAGRRQPGDPAGHLQPGPRPDDGSYVKYLLSPALIEGTEHRLRLGGDPAEPGAVGR